MRIGGIGSEHSGLEYSRMAAKAEPSSSESKNAKEGQGGITTVSTDKVDGELSRLKEKRGDIEKRLGAAASPEDEARLRDELSRIEDELREKDNDSYRRQHAEFHTEVDIMA